jgi:hypothetical protein
MILAVTYPPPPSNPVPQPPYPGPMPPRQSAPGQFAGYPAPPPGAGQPYGMPPAPRRRKIAGTAVSAGILALLTALIYGGYGLLAIFVVVADRGLPKGWLFLPVAVGGVLAFTGAILIFMEKAAAAVYLLVASGLFIVGSLLLSFVPFPEYLDGPNDPRMLIHLVGILPALIIGLLVLLPATRRSLRTSRQQGFPMPAPGPLPTDPVGRALAVAGSVCGFLLGLVLISVVLDVGVLGILDLSVLPQVISVILAVVGAFVVLGRKWTGGLLLAIGGGASLAYILIALFRFDGETDFRGVVFLLASIGALACPLIPATRDYLRAG